MGTGTIALIITAGVLVLFVGMMISIYNRLVAGRNQVENGWRTGGGRSTCSCAAATT